jgi:FtsP/CotA-like multicopper oxidase with cupredoxin domain
MNRREFIARSAAAAELGASLSRTRELWSQSPADVRLEIAPLKLEIAPGKHVETIAYNGQVPGPLIRWPDDGRRRS